MLLYFQLSISFNHGSERKAKLIYEIGGITFVTHLNFGKPKYVLRFRFRSVLLADWLDSELSKMMNTYLKIATSKKPDLQSDKTLARDVKSSPFYCYWFANKWKLIQITFLPSMYHISSHEILNFHKIKITKFLKKIFNWQKWC